jgi:hypothetical protein
MPRVDLNMMHVFPNVVKVAPNMVKKGFPGSPKHDKKKVFP